MYLLPFTMCAQKFWVTFCCLVIFAGLQKYSAYSWSLDGRVQEVLLCSQAFSQGKALWEVGWLCIWICILIDTGWLFTIVLWGDWNWGRNSSALPLIGTWRMSILSWSGCGLGFIGQTLSAFLSACNFSVCPEYQMSLGQSILMPSMGRSVRAVYVWTLWVEKLEVVLDYTSVTAVAGIKYVCYYFYIPFGWY